MTTSGIKGAANTGNKTNQPKAEYENGNGINSYILTTTEMQTNQSNGLQEGGTATQNREEGESQVNLLER